MNVIASHGHSNSIKYFPILYPVVPKGFSRIRIVFHAGNTEEEVEKLANSICEWAQEMLELEASGKGVKVPSAARQVHAAQEAAAQAP
jgi:8-amino-7-oxononanoate synthase